MSGAAHPSKPSGGPAAISEKRRLRPSFLLLLSGTAIAAGLALSVTTGAADIRLDTALNALLHYDENQVQHYTVMSVRLPRALTAVLVGACFGISGAMMQGMTRNPLASPSLMGVSAGAGFALVIAMALFPGLSYQRMIFVSLLGAAFGTLIVYAAGTISSSLASGANAHVRLALAGAAVSAMLHALSEGIQIYYGIAQEVMYWYAAGIAGVKWEDVRAILPWTVAGVLSALMLSRSITLLSLGDEVAAGLGQRLKRVKLLGSLTVFMLTGAAVAVAGPIGFIGLVIPHLTRFLIGVDYRYVIPCSGMLGGALLVTADTIARLVNPPQETPVGILTALIGVPFFLYLARKERNGGT
ncbi:FecCD family ABC transporter permease [Paenibacillus hodogayensis]|uniref:FecCD family ABC transporter permease n=1 Tax=Paenibacillus hodogayensis TaxID=279208 RepID=A0ABV5W169_9BACL